MTGIHRSSAVVRLEGVVLYCLQWYDTEGPVEAIQPTAAGRIHWTDASTLCPVQHANTL